MDVSVYRNTARIINPFYYLQFRLAPKRGRRPRRNQFLTVADFPHSGYRAFGYCLYVVFCCFFFFSLACHAARCRERKHVPRALCLRERTAHRTRAKHFCTVIRIRIGIVAKKYCSEYVSD